MISFALSLCALLGISSAHYLFPYTVYDGATSAEWQYVSITDNMYSRGPVTDVTDINMRCYDSLRTQNATQILKLNAGDTLGIALDGPIIHPGPLNVYMAKAPGSETSAQFDGAGTVWFKVYQMTAITNGGTSITWPTDNVQSISFTIPHDTPSGYYLVRPEHIALHVASTYGGAQWYLSCAQIQVVNGGSGTPGPLVALPGYYTGYEPGILINLYNPIPANYTQPGPPLWPATGSQSTTTVKPTTTTGKTTTTTGKSTTTITTSTKTTTTSARTTVTTPSSGCVALYGQCGGSGYTGSTTCCSGTCSAQNSFYSQCV